VAAVVSLLIRGTNTRSFAYGCYRFTVILFRATETSPTTSLPQKRVYLRPALSRMLVLVTGIMEFCYRCFRGKVWQSTKVCLCFSTDFLTKVFFVFVICTVLAMQRQ
jgi:hypothetical protein